MLAPRSILSVPASSASMIEKGLCSPADAIFLDLEDSVAPAEKARARDLAIGAQPAITGRVDQWLEHRVRNALGQIDVREHDLFDDFAG